MIRRIDTHSAHVAAWLYHSGRKLIADRCQAEAFLSLLDPGAVFFSFRSFSETHYTRIKGGDPLEHALHGSLADCWDRLVGLNRAGAAITVTINATNGTGRQVEDVVCVRALFVDDDHPHRRDVPLALDPQIRVLSSPGRFHHYWLVRNCPLADHSGYQRSLAEALDTDHRVLSLNQSMALPGFWRRKRVTTPCQTRLLEIGRVPAYDCAAAMCALLGGNAGDPGTPVRCASDQ